MAKNKETKYLPLRWAENLTEQLQLAFNRVIPPEDLRAVVEFSTPERKEAVLERNPDLSFLLTKTKELSGVSTLHGQNPFIETMSDLNSISLVMLWAKNKQVYAFDKDFSNELVSTETFSFSKDCLDYLPYDVFYVDISDNKELCDKVLCEGFFVKVEKAIMEELGEVYRIHVCKVSDKYFYNDVFVTKNVDSEISLADDERNAVVNCLESNKSDLSDLTKIQKTVDAIAYKLVVMQSLLYLSSVEPDVKENEVTKQTYRKPSNNATPKNKFSEIRKWDVGVRFGNAYRKWKSSNSTRSSGERCSTGAKQRPHSRKAHWSHYWYGHGEDKVRRPKWVSEYYVGLEAEEKPAVVHKVKSEGKKNADNLDR